MKTSSPVPPTLRFGVFELDPRAGELRKKGMKMRLQGQPVDVLAMLLERPGETITREICKRNSGQLIPLWTLSRASTVP